MARTRVVRTGSKPVFQITSNTSEKALYAALGVSETATPEDIHAAFLRIARAWHPDVHGGSLSPVFAAAKHAHDILMDPDKRAMYDETGMDPDDAANLIPKLAIQMIRDHAFRVLADGHIDANILQKITNGISASIRDTEGMIRRTEIAIEKVMRGAANIRARWTGGEGAKASILGMIERQLDADRATLTPHRRMVEVGNVALEILADCRYEMPNSSRYGTELEVLTFSEMFGQQHCGSSK